MTNSKMRFSKFLKNNIVGILILSIVAGVLGNYAYDHIKEQSTKSTPTISNPEKQQTSDLNKTNDTIDKIIEESIETVSNRQVSRLTWGDFKDVTFEKKWYDETKEFKVEFPIFGDKLLQYHGKHIRVTGYLHNLDKSNHTSESHTDFSKSSLLFTANPVKKCLLCEYNDHWNYVLEITTNSLLLKNLKSNSFCTLEGELILNDKNINRMIYILEDAKLISN